MANEANDALGWDLGAEGSVPGPWGNRMGDLIEDHNKRLAVLIDPQTALSAVKADNGKCQAFDNPGDLGGRRTVRLHPDQGAG